MMLGLVGDTELTGFLDPNPENTSYTLPEAGLPQSEDGEQSRTQMARGGREKPLESGARDLAYGPGAEAN